MLIATREGRLTSGYTRPGHSSELHHLRRSQVAGSRRNAQFAFRDRPPVTNGQYQSVPNEWHTGFRTIIASCQLHTTVYDGVSIRSRLRKEVEKILTP